MKPNMYLFEAEAQNQVIEMKNLTLKSKKVIEPPQREFTEIDKRILKGKNYGAKWFLPVKKWDKASQHQVKTTEMMKAGNKSVSDATNSTLRKLMERIEEGTDKKPNVELTDAEKQALEEKKKKDEEQMKAFEAQINKMKDNN